MPKRLTKETADFHVAQVVEPTTLSAWEWPTSDPATRVVPKYWPAQYNSAPLIREALQSLNAEDAKYAHQLILHADETRYNNGFGSSALVELADSGNAADFSRKSNRTT